MGSSNPWGDLDQMWRVRRNRGRNHVCNIWWLSVKGCGCGERGKFAFSHWLDASPLYNTGHTTVWPCDHFTVYAVLWTEKLIFLNKQCFYRYNKMFSGINSYTCSNAVFQHWHNLHSRFATRLLPCWWYVIRSRPRNPLFRYVKSLLLLWKPHRWF